MLAQIRRLIRSQGIEATVRPRPVTDAEPRLHDGPEYEVEFRKGEIVERFTYGVEVVEEEALESLAYQIEEFAPTEGVYAKWRATERGQVLPEPRARQYYDRHWRDFEALRRLVGDDGVAELRALAAPPAEVEW